MKNSTGLNPLIQCECGCENFLLKFDGRGRERLFIHGHNQSGIPKSEYWQSCIIKSRKGSKHTIETRSKIKSKLKELSDNGYVFGWKKGKSLSEAHKKLLYIARMNYTFPQKDSKPEKMMQLALSLKQISFKTHVSLDGQPDIFIEPNICIFVDGDYWHANPEIYNADDIIIGNTKASDIWARDIKVTHILTEKGYFVIRIWEHKILDDSSLVAENIISSIKNNNVMKKELN